MICLILAILLSYLNGHVYLLNLILAVGYSFIYFYLLKFAERPFNKLIRNTTVVTYESKKYTFHWLAICIGLFIFSQFLSTISEIVEIKWI